MRWESPSRFDAEVTPHQDEAEETVGDSLENEAHKNDFVPHIYQFLRRFKAASKSLWKD